jgi:hypothetical protein
MDAFGAEENIMKAYENIIVFLDTEVLEHENYNFESRKLSSLKKCNEQGIIKLYMTSINMNEVEKRIEKKVKHAEAAIKATRKDTLILYNIEEYKKSILDKEAFETYCQKLIDDFRTFLRDIKISIIPYEEIDPAPIFEAYFSDKKPFDVEKKKHEFPDAISISLIGKYIKGKEGLKCIVSGDNDVKSLIESLNIENLEYFDTLESFLDKVLPNAKVKEYLKENENLIEDAVKEKFEAIIINLDNDYYDSEEKDRKFNQLIIYDYSIIDSDNGLIYLQLKADITYEITIAYSDPNGMFWDSEEKDYISVGDTINKTFRNTETIDLEIECQKQDEAEDDWSIYVLDFSLSIEVDDII